MTGSMYAAVAGLKTHMNALNVIGNNVSNVNTYGYKAGRYTFNEALYTTQRSGSDGTQISGGRNPAQVGFGASIGTIDLDISCTEYTIGFDTAVNTAMEAIDKVKDTSSSHERCSIIEVMGRHAGYIALWCGIANGAEDILIPEKYDYNEQKIVDHIIENRRKGKKHHLIINAEGIGHSTSMAKRIEAATGIETRATILGYMQRGGAPSALDRVKASLMGEQAIECIMAGRFNRAVVEKSGKIKDIDLEEALNMTKEASKDLLSVARNLVRH